MTIRGSVSLSISRPIPMQLTNRDARILATIHAFDGIISLRQVDKLFFSGKGRTQPRHRMRTLVSNGYVAMPDADTQHLVPRDEVIYWLARKGAALVAGRAGKSLRELRWRGKPRYSLISHDLRVNDMRIAVQLAAEKREDVYLLSWIPESAFAVEPDKVAFASPQGKHRKRVVRPDGFFLLEYAGLLRRRQLAFLVEIDLSTEDNPRFAREKAQPGVAYLHSEAYRQRFGVKGGRYLVVTTGRRRLQNMKRQTERAGGKGLFYFTTFAEVTTETVFDQPIWQLAGKSGPQQLLPPIPY